MYTAAVIGCGRIGSLYDARRADASSDPLTHAGGYTADPRVTLVAGVDPVADRRAQFTAQWTVPAYATIGEVLAKVRPDLWSICTHSDSHLALVTAAVQAGARGILCEKPLAATLSEAVQLLTVCERAAVPLVVNHSRRFDAFHQDLTHRVQVGEWGRIQRVLIHYVRGIANYGSHSFDLLRFLLADEIQWVSARDELCESEADPSLTVYGQTCSDVPFVLLPTHRAHYDSLEVDLWGSIGRVTITHLGRGVRQYHVGPSPDWDEPAVLLERPGRFLPGMRGMIRAAIANLIANIEQGEPLLSSGRDGLSALAVVCAAKRSAERGGERIEVQQLLAEASGMDINHE